jgi:hypothetical protein
MQLGSTLTANGSTPSGGLAISKGEKTVAVIGTYNGASFALELSVDGGVTFQTLHTFTEAAATPKGLVYTGGLLRGTVTSAGGSTSLAMHVQ